MAMAPEFTGDDLGIRIMLDGRTLQVLAFTTLASVECFFVHSHMRTNSHSQSNAAPSAALKNQIACY